ncbi:hypothetical protein GCM10007304_30030 [Rhodococcoides trifolii]|uniref:Blue (type 1) copper domain-containing protein n=1 Tax=Rhodococcoides trifolii TaxID=908250 RepID=A0A917FY99_9NOCA|nr:plastocyanin/azurin family copper-binding protein [Rhodococcus trifolii]GGG13970.1 hypothetical protein GCM10007304_30030 [Rhodococcus trifolii]
MHRRFLPMLAVAALAFTATACSESSSAQAEKPTGPNVVTVSDMTYSPRSVTIDAGETVTWFFDDRGVAHNVIGEGNATALIHSPLISSGQFSATFDAPGTYNYVCTVHPDMTGVVIVR